MKSRCIFNKGYLLVWVLSNMDSPLPFFTVYSNHVMISPPCFSGFIWLPLEDTSTALISFWGIMLMSLQLMRLVSSVGIRAVAWNSLYVLSSVTG